MKKILLVLAVFVFAVVLAGTMACKSTHNPGTVPTVSGPQTVLFDDFVDGDNRTDPGAFGGYWYTFDDLSASNDNVTCGDSNIWPMSANAGTKYYAITTLTPMPTFVMSKYAVAPMETPPAGVTSAYYARVSGTVDRSGYPYGFCGFGANLLDVNPDGSKQTINFAAVGYTNIQFWAKNGPSVSGSIPWKIKLPTSYVIGTGCKMEDVDDQPEYLFNATNTWVHYNLSFATDFKPESWGGTTCGTRAALTTCVPGSISYIAGGAQYQCTAAHAITAMNALQWQTNFAGTTNGNAFDLEIAQITLTKN